MRYLTALILIASLLSIPFSSPVFGGRFEDAFASYSRGDYTTALRLTEPLAEQGNVEAQFNLGFMYDQGQSVPQDYAKAVKWYRKAAEQGESGAQLLLGRMYYEGVGVPQDYVLAHMWTVIGDSRIPSSHQMERQAALIIRNLIEHFMTPDHLVEAQRLARDWSRRGRESRLGKDLFTHIFVSLNFICSSNSILPSCEEP